MFFRPFFALLALALSVTSAQADTVLLQGMLGNKGLFIINGGAPRALGPGQSLGGVRVVSTQDNQAVVLIDGERVTLRVGQTPVSVGGIPTSSSDRVVLRADGRGHFIGQGSINQRPVQFMVDTGATTIALSQSEAERLGLDYRRGRPVRMSTANGITTGWLLKLNTVRLGDVSTYDVDAVVTPSAMPTVLLGNSFLNRFSMRRDGDLMTLIRR